MKWKNPKLINRNRDDHDPQELLSYNLYKVIAEWLKAHRHVRDRQHMLIGTMDYIVQDLRKMLNPDEPTP